MIVGNHMAIAKKAFDKFTLADIIADLPQKGQINITVSVPDIRGRVIIEAEEEVKDDSENAEAYRHKRTTMTTTKHQIMRNIYDVCSLHLLCACDMSVWYTEAGITRHLLDVGRDETRHREATLARLRGPVLQAGISEEQFERFLNYALNAGILFRERC